MIESIFDSVWLLADIFLFLALADSGSLLDQTFLLFRFCLWPVFVQEFEGLRGRVAVKDIRELGDGWRDFQAEVENLSLALQKYIFGPADHARQIPFRLNVLADAEVAGALLDQGILIH